MAEVKQNRIVTPFHEISWIGLADPENNPILGGEAAEITLAIHATQLAASCPEEHVSETVKRLLKAVQTEHARWKNNPSNVVIENIADALLAFGAEEEARETYLATNSGSMEEEQLATLLNEMRLEVPDRSSPTGWTDVEQGSLSQRP